ncbi:endonuclease 8-like 1 [Pseudophryne corroboree]|uniref:endonuclease 8-like 1 n=1 Tax=Pseudophryne corroboree TaxID=495146 RepID=UPI0030819517
MPEGPELHLSSLFVNRVCAGQIFGGKVEKSAVSKNAEVPFSCPEYTISAVSRGKEVKLILTPLSDTAQVAHVVVRFGMSGSFRFTTEGEMHKHAHLRFYTKHFPRQVLCFVDPRRFGTWAYNAPWQPDRGPCVMMEYEKFRERVLSNLSDKAFDKPICEALLNQKYFNGIGNYLRAEILFRLQIPPFMQARAALETVKHHDQNGDLTLSKKIKIKKENPDLLQLCHLVPLEVVKLGGKGYEPGQSNDYSAFLKWVQCYFVPGMKTLRDSNGRTIWFQGDPGPLAPKGKKARKQRKSVDTDSKPIKDEKTASKRKASREKTTPVKKERKVKVKVEPKEEATAGKKVGKKTQNVVEEEKTIKKQKRAKRVQRGKRAGEDIEEKINRRPSHRSPALNTPLRRGKAVLLQPEDTLTPKPRRLRSNTSLLPQGSPKIKLRTKRKSAVRVTEQKS